MIKRVGDTPVNEADIVGRFDLHFSRDFVQFLSQENMSVTFTTYEGGKLIIVGPGHDGATVTERNFERCMALFVEKDNIWISTHHNVLQLENGIMEGQYWQGQWDRIYLPRTALFTGGVDMHEITRANDGHIYGVVTWYNCIARLNPDEWGSFTPYWKPHFVEKIVPEDRCHLNGLCLEDGELAYVTMVAETDSAFEWRKHRNDGGLIIDIRTNEIIARGLCMPHTPRLYNGDLWFLEAGKGYLCKMDMKTREIERVLWRPGFLRGLHFYKNYAFICCSAPRDETFTGLPLDQELEKRGEQPRCALDIINLDTMEVEHSAHITGSVKEIYDVALLEGCRQPILYGFFGEEIRNITVLGEDETGGGPINNRSAKPRVSKAG